MRWLAGIGTALVLIIGPATAEARTLSTAKARHSLERFLHRKGTAETVLGCRRKAPRRVVCRVRVDLEGELDDGTEVDVLPVVWRYTVLLRGTRILIR